MSLFQKSVLDALKASKSLYNPFSSRFLINKMKLATSSNNDVGRVSIKLWTDCFATVVYMGILLYLERVRHISSLA